MAVKIGKDITLANGLNYSPENIDLTMLMNMKNIGRGYRFCGVPAHDNFTLQDHSFECYIIGSRWWDYLEKDGKNEILDVYPKSLIEKWGKGGKQLAKSQFSQACLIHDLNEIVTGDLVPTFKTKEFKEKEEVVLGDIKNFLGVSDRSDPKNILKKNMKIVDLSSSLYEVKQLMNKGYTSVRRIYDVRKEILDDFIPYAEVRPFLVELKIEN
jgi:hypothetical protein